MGSQSGSRALVEQGTDTAAVRDDKCERFDAGRVARSSSLNITSASSGCTRLFTCPSNKSARVNIHLKHARWTIVQQPIVHIRNPPHCRHFSTQVEGRYAAGLPQNAYSTGQETYAGSDTYQTCIRAYNERLPIDHNIPQLQCLRHCRHNDRLVTNRLGKLSSSQSFQACRSFPGAMKH